MREICGYVCEMFEKCWKKERNIAKIMKNQEVKILIANLYSWCPA